MNPYHTLILPSVKTQTLNKINLHVPILLTTFLYKQNTFKLLSLPEESSLNVCLLIQNKAGPKKFVRFKPKQKEKITWFIIKMGINKTNRVSKLLSQHNNTKSLFKIVKNTLEFRIKW
jgi:hypothetical protein